MKLKKLFNSFKKCKTDRKSYYIEWRPKFIIDDRDYAFFFIPTIMWVPWTWRLPNEYFFEILWLNMHFCCGVWRQVENCKKDPKLYLKRRSSDDC